MFARFFHGNAVGYGRHGLQAFYFMVFHAAEHAGCSAGLHSIDLHGGIQAFDGKCHAADQASASDGDDDDFHVGQLFEQFQSDSALSGNDQFVVEGMYECISFFVAELQGMSVGIVIDAFHQADVCSQPSCGFHFADGRSFGQADERLDAAMGGRQCHALGMIACRTGNDAFCFFFVGEL